MTSAQLNFWTVVVFVLALLCGWALTRLRDARRRSPQQQAAGRLEALLDSGASGRGEAPQQPDGALFHEYRQAGNHLSSWLSRRWQRLVHLCGKRFRQTMLAFALAAVTGELVLCWLLPIGAWWALLSLLLAPAGMLALYARWIEMRYKKRFLAQFPDALDLIIRAVRAGVPSNQAIGAAGKEFTDPLQSEFTQMGDGLRLGIDLKEVLADAQQRIAVPEFSFFAVCLLLQRETGGPLTETLENLAQIIRARRDLTLKAKALTAESRTASLFIAVVPFLLVALLWFLNHDYILPLFATPAGQTMLKSALALIATGLALIFWMSNLKV